MYGEKPGGLIVDPIELADPLADALATYATATGESDKPIQELQDEAIPARRLSHRCGVNPLQQLARRDRWDGALSVKSARLRVTITSMPNVTAQRIVTLSS